MENNRVELFFTHCRCIVLPIKLIPLKPVHNILKLSGGLDQL